MDETYVDAYVTPTALLDGGGSTLARAREALSRSREMRAASQPPASPAPLPPPSRNWAFIGEGPAPELQCPVCLNVLHQARATACCSDVSCLSGQLTPLVCGAGRVAQELRPQLLRALHLDLAAGPAGARQLPLLPRRAAALRPRLVRARAQAVPPAALTWPTTAHRSSLSVPNFAARGAVARLRVRCRFDGCDSELTLADVAAHEAACEHRDADAEQPSPEPPTPAPPAQAAASPAPPSLPQRLAQAVAEAEARAEAAHAAADTAMARLRAASEARAAVEARRHAATGDAAPTFTSTAVFDLVREARAAARQMATDAAQHSAALAAAASAVSRASTALERARADRDAAERAAREADARAGTAEAIAAAARTDAGRMRVQLLAARADSREREAALEERCTHATMARDGQAAALRAALSVLSRVSARSRAEAAAEVARVLGTPTEPAAAPEPEPEAPPQVPLPPVATRFPELARVHRERRAEHQPDPAAEAPGPAEDAPPPPPPTQEQQPEPGGEGRMRRLAHDLRCLDRRLADLSASLTQPPP